MAPEWPSRDEIRKKLLDLLVGRISREDAASWADTWVIDDHPRVEDFVVWDALIELCGTDLRVNETDYLHNEADFRRWLDRVEEADGQGASAST